MNIVICEDSISDRHKLEKVITKVLIKNNLNSEIILSTNNSADVIRGWMSVLAKTPHLDAIG